MLFTLFHHSQPLSSSCPYFQSNPFPPMKCEGSNISGFALNRRCESLLSLRFGFQSKPLTPIKCEGSNIPNSALNTRGEPLLSPHSHFQSNSLAPIKCEGSNIPSFAQNRRRETLSSCSYFQSNPLTLIKCEGSTIPKSAQNLRRETLSSYCSYFQKNSFTPIKCEGSNIPKFAQNTRREEAYRIERGLEFSVGDAFFREESATGRDLGVLAAKLHKKDNKGRLKVLDALCGCGIRSLRYLAEAEAEADFVVANDGNEGYGSTIVENLSRVSGKEEGRWVVTHLEANRVMMDYYLQKSFFDFIDVDSFGSDSSFLRSAISTLKLGGLLYVTSTDGYSSGGHRPHHSLAAYGAYVRPMPYSNEVGLRMLIGGAAREAAVLGYHITPLFSYYAFHGPVFRVMLRLNRGKIHDSRHYGYIGYCHQCGNSHEFSWDQLGQMSCSCSVSKVSNSLVVSGPLWTGPLHDAAYLMDMLNLAKQWGWIECDGKDSLEKLIKVMVDESDPKLPFGYIKLDEMASRAKINSPPLKTLMSAIRQKGYAASRSHISTNAIKTNCPMTECIKIAKELLQVSIA